MITALHHDPPYLCDMEVLNIRTRFQIEGIHAEDLSEEEKQKLAAEGKDPDQIDFEGTDLERKVTNGTSHSMGSSLDLILHQATDSEIRRPAESAVGDRPSA